MHPAFDKFLQRFSDNFGVGFVPVVLLVRADASPIFFDIGALASFRDLIAISVISQNRALELVHPRGHRVVFGEAFGFYPWMIDKHYEHLIGQTPAILGIHEVGKLRGQSSPALFRTPVTGAALDEPLLAELLRRWQQRYGSDEPDWPDIALFRSLNMAYHASLMPAATDATFLDVGRLISLWVSALEILTHPGGKKEVRRDDVLNLIDGADSERPALSERLYDTGGRQKVKRGLAAWLCQQLYNCRNDFLHGNPVTRDSLLLPTSQRSIFHYAAPLYRIALSAFLPLRFDQRMPPPSDPRAIGAYVADLVEFRRPQRVIEDALLTAQAKPDTTENAHGL